MTILYALLVLLAAVLVTTITSLYDLTIQLFNQLNTSFMFTLTVPCTLVLHNKLMCRESIL